MAADERRLLQDHLESLISTEFSSIANTSANPGPESGALAALSSPSKLAGLIDHTLLSASATPADVVALTEAAAKHGCATVCVNSAYIPLVARTLGGAARPVPIAVVGFPLGAGLTAAKAFEAREAIRAGAREIDMVQHVGYLKAKDYATVYTDIKAVVDACAGVPVKVILETCLLSADEIIASSVIAYEAGAAFVKTSTGFSTGGATVEAVRLMRAVTHDTRVKVKASGGIGSLADVRCMVEAGAERIGASRTAQILKDADHGADAGASATRDGY